MVPCPLLHGEMGQRYVVVVVVVVGFLTTCGHPPRRGEGFQNSLRRVFSSGLWYPLSCGGGG
jgi:hypothetical protein